MLLRDSEIFRAVMSAGTTSRAAQIMNISQPAVSQALKRLEKRAGITLFERLRGRLQPRPEAQALLTEVDRCLAGFDDLEQRLINLQQFSVDRLRISSYPALGLAYLPRVIANMRRKSDKLNVSLQIASSSEVREHILAQRCEIGLMADEVTTVGIQHSVLHRANGVIAMHAKHPLASKKVISAKAFLSYPHVALNPEDASRKRLVAAIGSSASQFNPVVETPYGVTICELALSNVGIGLVNPLIARTYKDRGLVLVPFELPIEFKCLLGTQPGKPLSSTAQQFLTSLRKLLS